MDDQKRAGTPDSVAASALQYGAIILCGGGSRRMGYPKALLPFGPECLLQRAVRLLAEVVKEPVVVTAPGQDLPPLPATVHITQDREDGLGPLEGIRAGLSALPDGMDAAYITGCDMPFIAAAFVRCLAGLLGNADVAVPYIEGHYHPLAAMYHRRVVPVAHSLLANGHRRPIDLFDRVAPRLVTEPELVEVDSTLASLRNINCPTDYFRALREAGFCLPTVIQ